jgi:glycosyltransferase involved in cell wall biosynthesis
MFSGKDIICISSIEWDFVWQGHQEIASRLAQAGNRVLYIENTGVRSPGLRDAARVFERVKNSARSMRSGGVRLVAPNIYVCSPIVFPPFGMAWRRQINRRFWLSLVRRAARRLGMQDVVILTYLPTDTALDLIETVRTPRSVLVYYCIADFAQLAPRVGRLKESERRLVASSDLIFAQGPEIAMHCSQWSDEVHIFPFGVDLDKFTPANPLDPGPSLNGVPQLRSLPRPVIGYIGGIHRHIDYGLLIEMARARSDWSWVFVGPIQTSVGELADLPNVHLLGQQPHETLARYIQQFDVCMVPYVNSHYTATVVPTKINEYLAVGKPVVSTRLPPVCEFNRQHMVLETAATEPAAFLNALEQALRRPMDQATIARRRQVATLGDWVTRTEAMSELIAAAWEKKSRGPVG